jgi:hypothetical protein
MTATDAMIMALSKRLEVFGAAFFAFNDFT